LDPFHRVVREPSDHSVEANHGQPPAIDQVIRSEPYSNPISSYTGTNFDRVIDQPADLRSNTDMAVIVSSPKTTARTMNSIHSLLARSRPRSRRQSSRRALRAARQVLGFLSASSSRTQVRTTSCRKCGNRSFHSDHLCHFAIFGANYVAARGGGGSGR